MANTTSTGYSDLSVVEGLAALQELEPLAFDHDSDSLAVHGRVHEPLFLEAVSLQRRVDDAASDTDGWGDGVLSRDHQIDIAFADGKGVPPFQVQDVSQVNRIARSDFNVLMTSTKRVPEAPPSNLWELLRWLRRQCATTSFGGYRNNKGVDVLDRAECYLEHGDITYPGWSTAEFDPNPPKHDRWGDIVQ